MEPDDDLTKRHDKLREKVIGIEPDVKITVVKLSETEQADMYNKWINSRKGVKK
jgi:hypothetical protein